MAYFKPFRKKYCPELGTRGKTKHFCPRCDYFQFEERRVERHIMKKHATELVAEGVADAAEASSLVAKSAVLFTELLEIRKGRKREREEAEEKYKIIEAEVKKAQQEGLGPASSTGSK